MSDKLKPNYYGRFSCTIFKKEWNGKYRPTCRSCGKRCGVPTCFNDEDNCIRWNCRYCGYLVEVFFTKKI